MKRLQALPHRSRSGLTASRQAAVLVITSGVSAVLSLAFVVYVGRRLGPAQYADFATALSLILIATYALGPIQPILTKLTAESVARNDAQRIKGAYLSARKLTFYAIAVVLVPASVLVLSASKALRLPGAALIYLSFFVACLTLALNLPRAIMRGTQRYGAFGLSGLAEVAVRAGAGVAILSVSPTPQLAIAAYAIGLLVAWPFAYKQANGTWAQAKAVPLDKSSLSGISSVMFLQAAALALFQNTDVLFAKHYLPGVEAGIYSAAATVARSIGVLFIPFNALMLPQVAFVRTKGRSPRRTILTVCALFAGFAGAFLALVSVQPHQLMQSLFGRAYRDSGSLVLQLGAALTLGFLGFLIGQALIAIGRWRATYVFFGGAVGQTLLLCWWHTTPAQIVSALLLAQAVTFVAMSVAVVRGGTSLMAAPGRPLSR